MLAVLATVVLGLIVAAGGAGRSVAATTAPRVQATGANPCVGAPPAARLAHVIVIMLENHSYSDIIGSGAAPHMSALASECGVASNYHNITHPSLPNYVALTAGSTFGLQSDLCHCMLPVGGVFLQMQQTHQSWATYAENMTTPCDPNSVGGTYGYTPHHNPVIYYSKLRTTCRKYDLRMGSTTSGALNSALADGHLPTFTLMIPNLCDDMHACSVQHSDAWVGAWVHRIIDSYQYQHQSTVIFITWDEGDGGHIGAGENCAANLGDESCHVPLIVISRMVRPHSVARAYFTHYSLLHTIDALTGLPSLRNAATAPAGLGAAFHL